MLHHFLQRGIKPEYIMNLPLTEKMFYRASMDLFIEEETAKYRALTGGEA